MTFLVALRSDSITAPCVFDGPINGSPFPAWTTQFPMPTVRLGDIVVVDNLNSHKRHAVRLAILDAGANLFFVPPCSPDLRPSEMVFTKLETLLRKADKPSIAVVSHRIGTLINQFSHGECTNHIRHAGYDYARSSLALSKTKRQTKRPVFATLR